MQKLHNEVVKKMIEKKTTSDEIDFIIYISRFQQDNGMIRGVYYKDVKDALGFSVQQFYNVKKSLIQKGIISTEKNSYYDHDITILNNDFSNPEVDIYKGYINTNHDIFYSDEFKKMKANSKLIALDLMKNTREGKNSFQITVENLYRKYTEFFGVQIRIIRQYIKELKEFFYIGIKDKKYFITPKRKIYRSIKRKSETDNYNENEVKVFCRRNKIKTGIQENDIRDVARLCKQYGLEAKDQEKDIFQILKDSVLKSLETLGRNFSSKGRILQPKLVHIYVRSLLGLAK